MNDTITRIITMKQYIDHAGARSCQLTTKELRALADYTRQDLFGAVMLAFNYGQAMAKEQEELTQLLSQLPPEKKQEFRSFLRALHDEDTAEREAS